MHLVREFEELDRDRVRTKLGAARFHRFWRGYEPGDRYDLRKHLADFETRRDAAEERWSRVAMLRSGDRNERLLGELLADYGDRKPANLACCPITAREFRIWWNAEQLRVFEAFERLWIIHPILHRAVVPFGELHTVRWPVLKMRLRRQLERSAGAHVIAMGGCEVNCDYQRKLWVPHFHVTVANADRASLELLRGRHYRDCDDWTGLMDIGRVDDRIRQISYNLKFFVLSKPHRKNSPRWRDGYRLRRREHNEFMCYLAARAPTELTFTMNVSRNNTLTYRVARDPIQL